MLTNKHYMVQNVVSLNGHLRLRHNTGSLFVLEHILSLSRNIIQPISIIEFPIGSFILPRLIWRKMVFYQMGICAEGTSPEAHNGHDLLLFYIYLDRREDYLRFFTHAGETRFSIFA